MKKKLHIFLAISCALLIASCTKDDSMEAGGLPQISTSTVSSVTSYGAVVGGSAISVEGSPVLTRGICYGTGSGPVVGGNSTTLSSGSGDGSFTCVITGLSNNTKYCVRAFATNNGGISYGNQQIFTTTFAVGENYQGGILFYIDNTHQHGLIAATVDQDSSAIWGCAGTSVSTTQIAYGTGQQNTNAILNACTTTGIAAALCNNLVLNGYSDWYLPSYNELKLLYAPRDTVGGFTNNYYWSSSEYDSGNAYWLNFADGSIVQGSKSSKASVRAIRAF